MLQAFLLLCHGTQFGQSKGAGAFEGDGFEDMQRPARVKSTRISPFKGIIFRIHIKGWRVLNAAYNQELIAALKTHPVSYMLLTNDKNNHD